jgi:membrane protein DedA with SNARE-associated domain
MNVAWVLVAATLGSVLGALVLYGLGAAFGEQRARRWLTRLPLVDESDFDQASAWFHRHGHGVVFFGRFVPIVRSLVSLPAGAQRMPLLPFVVLTLLGSLLWNALLIGAGYGLGTQYERVEDYLAYLDYVVFAAIAAVLGWWIMRKRRQRRAADTSA